jgi:regulator of RNase E activity RraA
MFGRSADARAVAIIGEWTVTGGDVVFGDEDGALFVPRPIGWPRATSCATK